MKARVDILVIGGGPVGACCALRLAESGASVALIEKETEVCPPGSGAHANCGLLAPSHIDPVASPGALGQGLRWILDSSSPFYIAPRLSPALARWLWLFRAAATPARARAASPILHALNSMSAGLHDELAARPATASNGDVPSAAPTRGDRWLFHHDGCLQVFETPGALESAALEAQTARDLGMPVESVSPEDVRGRFPSMRAAPAGALFYPNDGHLDPLLFTREVAAMASAAGAEVRRGTEALSVEPGQTSGVRIVTTRGDLVADQVVIAAGAWTPGLTHRLGLALPIEPAKGYSVDVRRPSDFPELPLYLGDAHCVITPLGDTLRLGSTLELSGWDMRVRPRRVAGLRRSAERVLGLPADAPVRQIWRGPRPLTPDGLPVIGRLPRQSRVILATGHCMLGLTLGPATGRLVTELAGGDRPSVDLAPLAVQRFS